MHNVGKLVKLFFTIISRYGIHAALSRVANYTSWLRKTRFERKTYFQNPSLTREERFTQLYLRNGWGSEESRSGEGSTLSYTVPIRKALASKIKLLGVNHLFDAPCGDFGWMKCVLEDLEPSFEYTGADIVRELVDELNKDFGSNKIRFQHLDLVRDFHPKADLFFCRDLLFHLSLEDVREVFRNFLASTTPLIMVTTHPTGKANRDIVSGGFRLLDLSQEPFNLPHPSHGLVDDYLPPDPQRQMGIWTREEVQESLNL